MGTIFKKFAYGQTRSGKTYTMVRFLITSQLILKEEKSSVKLHFRYEIYYYCTFILDVDECKKQE